MKTVKNIRQVNVYRRTDITPNDLASYQVRVGNDPNPYNNPSCGSSLLTMSDSSAS